MAKPVFRYQRRLIRESGLTERNKSQSLRCFCAMILSYVHNTYLRDFSHGHFVGISVLFFSNLFLFWRQIQGSSAIEHIRQPPDAHSRSLQA